MHTITRTIIAGLAGFSIGFTVNRIQTVGLYYLCDTKVPSYGNWFVSKKLYHISGIIIGGLVGSYVYLKLKN